MYTTLPLASHSGNEKRINKAIKESKQQREEKKKTAETKWKQCKSPLQRGSDDTGPKRNIIIGR